MEEATIVAVAHCCGVVGKKFQELETAWDAGRTNKLPVPTMSKFVNIMRRKKAADVVLSFI